MNYLNISEDTLETLIEGLQSAVNMCYNVDTSLDNSENSYPYATGYSRSAMQSVIQQLEQLKFQAK